MLPLVILGIALLVGLLLIGRWYVQADPKLLIKLLRLAAILVGLVFVALIVLSGRWGWLPVLLFVALPWLSRFRALATFAKNMRGPSPGQASEIQTRFVRMQLDHDSGAMDGVVVEGAHAGRRLGDMSLGELIALWHDCAADQQSQAVMTSYLDRVHGDTWRAAAGSGAGSTGGSAAASASPGAMTREEACEILGVEAGASPEEIERAYRRLMLKAHPDHGGSDWLAAKINQAKELLFNG